MYYVGEANKPISVGEWIRLEPYECSEHITSPTGNMVMKDDFPVDGPRQHRYGNNTKGQISVMIPFLK